MCRFNWTCEYNCSTCTLYDCCQVCHWQACSVFIRKCSRRGTCMCSLDSWQRLNCCPGSIMCSLCLYLYLLCRICVKTRSISVATSADVLFFSFLYVIRMPLLFMHACVANALWLFFFVVCRFSYFSSVSLLLRAAFVSDTRSSWWEHLGTSEEQRRAEIQSFTSRSSALIAAHQTF